MKILFLPSDGGGGFGHVSRCLVLAQEAQRKGHACFFALSNRRYESLLTRDFPVFVARTYRRRYSDWRAVLLATKQKVTRVKPPPVLFTGFSTLDYQVVRDGLTDEHTLEHVLGQYLEAAQKFKPDVVIGDTNLMARTLAKKAMLPIVQIVRYATHPDTNSIIWWDGNPDMMKPPDSLRLFNPWFERKGLDSIARVGDLLRGDLYLVPSIPELEPIAPDPQTMHTGQLSVTNRKEPTPDWMQAINDSLPIVYVTIGGGAGQVGNNLFFQTVVQAFADKPVRVVVSTTDRFNKRDFPSLPGNIVMFPWVPGKLVISKADLVIFHGGFGTMMECVTYGKPSIVIPFQTEQEGNGRRLEQLRCGILLRLSEERGRIVTEKWPYGKFTFLIQRRYDLTAEALYAKVNKILTDNEYVNKAKVLQSIVGEYQGAAAAIGWIEKHWG
jgi:UDP:flavonoid glycosyltransferase YjiC (YdhE family)